MNPDPPTKHSGTLADVKVAPRGDESGWLKHLLRGVERDTRRQRSSNPYPDAVAGSSDPRRRRRAPHVAADGRVEHMPASGPGSARRWRAEDGKLHRSKKTAGQRAVLVTVET